MSGVPNNMNRMLFLVVLDQDYADTELQLVATTDHWETKHCVETGMIGKPFENTIAPSDLFDIEMIEYRVLERFFDLVKLGFYFDGVQYAKQDNQG